MSEYSFGIWIKRRRKALDLTQHDLDQQVRCSPSLIFKIESDERRPSRQIAELLADHLEIPTEQRALFLKITRQEKGMDSLDAKRLFLQAYANASQAQWMPTILEVLVAFLFIDDETPPDEKLAALLSVLMQSATPPRLRSKAEGLRDELIAALETEQVELAKALAAEKSPEAWAQDIPK